MAVPEHIEMNVDGIEFIQVDVGDTTWTGIPMVTGSGPDAYPDSLHRLDREPSGPGGPVSTDESRAMFVPDDADLGVAVGRSSLVARGRTPDPAIEFVEWMLAEGREYFAGTGEGENPRAEPSAEMSLCAELGDGPPWSQHYEDTLTTARALPPEALSEFGLGEDCGWITATQPGTDGIGTIEMEFTRAERPTVTLAGHIPTGGSGFDEVEMVGQEEYGLLPEQLDQLEILIGSSDDKTIPLDEAESVRARTERAMVKQGDTEARVVAGCSDYFRSDDDSGLAPFEHSDGIWNHACETIGVDDLGANGSTPAEWLEAATAGRKQSTGEPPEGRRRLGPRSFHDEAEFEDPTHDL